MPIGKSDYSHRNENLQKLAKLAGKMGAEQDSRIIVNNGGFVQGSTTAWLRAPSNKAAQVEFKKILNENYGMVVADQVAKDFSLQKLWSKGKHLSADLVIAALERAEAYKSGSDEHYWASSMGRIANSNEFRESLKGWTHMRVGLLDFVEQKHRAAVVDKVMADPDLNEMLKQRGIVDREFIQDLLSLAYGEIERAASEVVPGAGGDISDYYGASCGDPNTQNALVKHLALNCRVPMSLARKALAHPEFKAVSADNNSKLTEYHVEVLMSYVEELNVSLSPAFVDQSQDKVKVSSPSGMGVGHDGIVLVEFQADGKGGYSEDTQKVIDSKAAYGLIAYNRPEYQIDKSGVSYDRRGIQSIGDKYVYVRNKGKGVEPGFEARKAFRQEDYNKVFHQPNHKYYQAADAFLKAEMAKPGSPIYKGCSMLRLTGDLPYPSAYIDTELKDDDSDVSKYVKQLEEQNELPLEDDGKTVDHQALNAMLLDHFSERAHEWADLQALPLLRENFTAEIVEHITGTMPMFTKLHFVKLDYKESDMKGDLVRIPKEKSKGKIHRAFTAQTKKEANESAAQEAIANDLLRMLGVYSQKLKIIRSEYSDGTPKLLLDGTFMKGPNGENFNDFAGCIVDGYLVSSEDAEMHKERKLQPGQCIRTDQSVEDLGKFLIFMLGLADRDAIGSRGDNKGRCGNTFAGIDPGHSLEVGKDSLTATNLMSFENIHSDFSFDQPGKIGDKLSKGYKNFDVFQDRPYLEKMAGIDSWLALRESGEDLALFDAYLEVFNGVDEDGVYHSELDFREKVGAMKTAYVARRDYILDKVFADRAPFLSEDHEPYGKPALEIVDALEKLTSVTSMTSPSGVVALKHPRVVSRVQWDMSEKDENVFFTAKKPGQAGPMLIAFGLGNPPPDGVKLQTGSAGTLRLVVPKDQVVAFSGHLNEAAVVQHKHPGSMSYDDDSVAVQVPDSVEGVLIEEDDVVDNHNNS